MGFERKPLPKAGGNHMPAKAGVTVSTQNIKTPKGPRLFTVIRISGLVAKSCGLIEDYGDKVAGLNFFLGTDADEGLIRLERTTSPKSADLKLRLLQGEGPKATYMARSCNLPKPDQETTYRATSTNYAAPRAGMIDITLPWSAKGVSADNERIEL